MIRNAFVEQRIIVQGKPHVQLQHEDIYWNDQPAYILYPGRGAKTIDQIPECDRMNGIHLIVPDGSWRQSSSMLKRIRPLQGTKTIMLSQAAPEHRRQRMNISPERMSTLEAIILAIHQLEGNPSEESTATLKRLMHFYQMYADCMLMMRGKLRISDSTLPVSRLSI
jgi:DTW domain-containing protein YfiP